MIWGSIPDRTKRFLSLSNCLNWLWDNPALLFNGYSEAAGGNSDHYSHLPSAEVKKDLSNCFSLYIPSWHEQGQFYSSAFIVVLQLHVKFGLHLANMNLKYDVYFRK
jgi:hypothetical protein